MKKILHILLLPIVLAASCKKDGLTKETQTGANTFSCKVNGKVYTPSGGDGWSVWPIEGGGYQDVDGNVGLYIRTISGNTKYIDIYIKKINSTGIYYLNSNTWGFPCAVRSESYGSYSAKDNAGNYSDFITNTRYTGWVNLKYMANHIYAGTFEFTAYNQQTGETVTITDGRFDIKN